MRVLSRQGNRARATCAFGGHALVPHIPRAHDAHAVSLNDSGAHGCTDVLGLPERQFNL